MRSLCVGVVSSFAASVALASTFTVTNLQDAQPSFDGTLRKAVENANTHPGPDTIVFDVAAGTISLIDVLRITDGALTITGPDPVGLPDAPATPLIFIDGAGFSVTMDVTSSRNVFENLGFAGPQSSYVAVRDGANGNKFTRCQFGVPGRFESGGLLLGQSLSVAGDTRGTEIESSLFLSSSGLLGRLRDGIDAPPTVVRNSWFGWDGTGRPGRNNSRSIDIASTHPVQLIDNTFAGPGSGIVAQVDRADLLIVRNKVVDQEPAAAGCGFSGSAILVSGFDGRKAVEHNVITCGHDGITINAQGPTGSFISDNHVGPDLTGSGIVVASAENTVVRHNTVFGVDSVGILTGGNTLGTSVSCNSVFDTAGSAVLLTNAGSPPPALANPTALSIGASVSDIGVGTVEIFGSDSLGARTYYGYSKTQSSGSTVEHALPVLDLMLRGSALQWNESTSANFAGTRRKSAAPGNTSSLGSSRPRSVTNPVFDVIRGRVAELARATDLSISLGTVTCLANDRPIGLAQPLTDAAVPVPGDAFFYLVRRDDSQAATVGTYDPAVCAADARSFSGPRVPATGDCAH